MKKDNVTQGNLWKAMLQFSLPYLAACFLQTFYGMADLFITGQFHGADQVTAVSIGSQVMHMVTVMIVGLTMGTTILISQAVGARDKRRISLAVGNSVLIFTMTALFSTVILIGMKNFFLNALKTPTESLEAANRYLLICFCGIPFIVAVNVISSIYRGCGDTKHPMLFVGISGIFNIGLDYLLVGVYGLGAQGAAIATIAAQAVSVIAALFFLRRHKNEMQIHLENIWPDADTIKRLLVIGVPICCQDGFIQISFLVITMIANMRGLEVAAAVGIVEKIISFLFLIPSAMLSTVSAVTARNVGAGLYERGKKTLRYGIRICVVFGCAVSLVCLWAAPAIVSLFIRGEEQIALLGGEYLRSYSLDCIFAGIHFCFSGYFSAYGKSMYSFIHNLCSIILIRIPGAYAASLLFPETLFPMGLAAPAGSLFSTIICIWLYRRLMKDCDPVGVQIK